MNRVAVAAFVLSTLFLTACTREVAKKASISVAMPSSLSSLSASEYLELVIVNVRATATSAPKVWEFEFENSSIAMGAMVPITIQGDIPNSKTLLVQVLGVFKTGAGSMRFVYGDTTADSSQAGDITVNISAAIFGSSAKEGRVAGRYITNDTPALTGPTGELITLFAAPNGKPEMAVTRDTITNGWFNIMVLDGTQSASEVHLRYLVQKDDGTTEYLFPTATGQMNLSNGLFSGSDPNTVAAKVILPARYRREYNNGTSVYEAEPATDLIYGFFRKDAATATGTFSSLLACKPGGNLTIEDVKVDTNSDGTPDALLPFFEGSTGGYANPYIAPAYGSSHAICANTAAAYNTELKFFSQYLGESHDGDAFGFRSAFRLIDPTANDDSGYLKIDVDSTLAPNLKHVLRWSWLPGVYSPSGAGAAGVDGVRVFIKAHSNYSGGGDDRDCAQEAQDEGMSLVGDVITNVNTLTVNGPPGWSYFSNTSNASNWVYGYYYKLCPFRSVAGVRKYASRGVTSGCVGTCSSYRYASGFGNKVPGYSPHNGFVSSSYTTGSLGGGSARISSVAVGATETVVTTYNAIAAFAAGDQALVVVSSNSSGSSCGAWNGNPILAGQYEFVPMNAVNTGLNQITFPKGTFVDGLSSVPLGLALATAGHCYVQVVKVLQFGNLTLNASSSLSAEGFDTTPNGGGGVVAVRVNGTLTMGASSTISASGNGFAPVASASGVGPNGSVGNYIGSINGGAGGGNHLGLGSGIGAGGNGGGDSGTAGAVGAPGGGGSGYGGGLHLIMGSSGGSGYATPSANSNLGGAGGGIIMIVARKIDVQGVAVSIRADGTSGFSAVVPTNPPGGGAAGGSVIVQSPEIVGATNLQLGALGGLGYNSNTSSQFRSGGGGGGGFVQFRSCASQGTLPLTSGAVAGGVTTGSRTDESVNPSTAGTDGVVDMPAAGSAPFMDNCP